MDPVYSVKQGVEASCSYKPTFCPFLLQFSCQLLSDLIVDTLQTLKHLLDLHCIFFVRCQPLILLRLM